MNRYSFRIVPVSGKPFEVIKFGETATDTYDAALRLYGSMALDVIPLGKVARIKSGVVSRPLWHDKGTL